MHAYLQIGDGYGDGVRVRIRGPGHLGTFAGNPGHPWQIACAGINSFTMELVGLKLKESGRLGISCGIYNMKLKNQRLQ